MSLLSQIKGQPILVTGAAGFIGFHLSRRLLAQGHVVVGLDNVNDYYDPRLKESRLDRLAPEATGQPDDAFTFIRGDLADRPAMRAMFEKYRFPIVVNLAAQAGVRYSIENPESYIDANLVGFGNILEGCRHFGTQHLVYASSSSVYGANTTMPFSVNDPVNHPVSLYAASKKANELMAHTYSHLYSMPTTGLRFFTVYGPWGRPDMALYKFTKAILEGQPIDVYNNGVMQRDFTYIDDIIEGVLRVMDRKPAGDPDWSSDAPNPSTSRAPYKLYNIGNNQPVELMKLITTLEDAIGTKAEKNMMPMQPGDVHATWADVDDLIADTGFKPDTQIEVGVKNFVDWYRGYNGPA